MTRTYLEASEVWDVVEGNLLNVELEATLVRDATERAVACPLQVSNLDFATVALTFVHLPLVKRDGVRVLVAIVLGKLIGVEAYALAELGELCRLEAQKEVWLRALQQGLLATRA